VFDPHRFGPGRAEDILPYSYLPFGGGPRTCIGNGFAMMEIMLLAATVLQQFQLKLENEQHEVESELEVVLRVKGELRMRPVLRRAMWRAA
jgi:cytochrome P450